MPEERLIEVIAKTGADEVEIELRYTDALRHIDPEEIVRLLTHFAAELDKDAKDIKACLAAGKLPSWIKHNPGGPEQN